MAAEWGSQKSDFNQMLRAWQDTKEYRDLNWTGTFNDYIALVRQNPKITRNAYQRLFDLIMEKGTEEYIDFKKHVIHYKFFSDEEGGGRDAVFGLDVPLMKLMNTLRAAALGYGAEKRVILLHGPVGSSKSTICRLIKKGVEQYSRTEQGAVYTFEWIDESGKNEDVFGPGVRVYPSPMHEEPLLLLPEDLRQKLCDEMNRGAKDDFRVQIQGELCPPSRFIMRKLLDRYNGQLDRVLEHVRVKRLVLNEADRIGIGTFQPKDEKNQDSTELTGDLNYRKIAEYGSDSDPRAFNFDGEFNIANRGIIEFVEMLKLDVAFLYDLLGASQEHRVKPKKFAQTHIDEVIIGHTNEPEFRRLQDNEFMEALRDRTIKIDVPYITRWTEEIKIYKKDFNSKRLRGVSIAPHAIEMAAMWAVLTRIEKPKKANLTRLQKLKLYDGKSVANFNEDNVKELRKEAKREGLDGISPRYVQDKISNAIVVAQQQNKGSVTPMMVLSELESGLKNHALLTNNDERRNELKELIEVVRQEYEETIKTEVQRAVCGDDQALQRLCANYIDNVKAFCTGGRTLEPDERLMRSIEEKVEIPESRKDDFRREIMNYIETLSQEGKKFDFKTNERLHRALEKKLFEDQKDSIKLFSVVESTESADTRQRVAMVRSRLIKDFGYDEVSAEEVLQHVASVFARGEVKERK
jgi:serine protein kinase